MPVKILMPALSPTMEVGKLAKWHKKEGDAVVSGDVLAEIETDKATMEMEAVDEGTLAKIEVLEGTDNVPVNAVIAWLLEEGEGKDALEGVSAETPAATPKPAPQTEPRPQPQAEPHPQPPPQVPPPPPQAAPPPSGGRILASPLARRLAREKGLDLSRIAGSGPKGRIIRADVDASTAFAASGGVSPGIGRLPAIIPPGGEAPYVEIPHSPMRRVIAERLSASKREAPHFYLTVECVIDDLLAARKRINKTLGEEGGKVSVNDFLILALGRALVAVPEANVSWGETALKRYTRADVAVAVAVPDGLVTPVIRDAANLGLAEISSRMKDFSGRAREGKLTPEEYTGGTITLTNLGMYGIEQFDAVINPPQGCILAIGAGVRKPVVRTAAKEEEIVPATVLAATLSVDHRAVDGVAGAKLLAAFKTMVEDPLTMLL